MIWKNKKWRDKMRKKGATFQHSTWRKLYLLKSSPNELDKEYGAILSSLVDYRLYLGLTQKELAARSGLSVSMISKIESQNSNFTLKTFLKYLRGLDLNLNFFSED